MHSFTVLSLCRWIIAFKSDLRLTQQNAEDPREAFELVSANTGWQLEQMAELQNEFTAGPNLVALHYSGEKEGEGDSGEWRDRPWGVILIIMHHVFRLEKKKLAPSER